jgi:hypothetical protein
MIEWANFNHLFSFVKKPFYQRAPDQIAPSSARTSKVASIRESESSPILFILFPHTGHKPSGRSSSAERDMPQVQTSMKSLIT